MKTLVAVLVLAAALTAPDRAGSVRYRDTTALSLRRAPYLGVRCPTPNSIACDRVGLAVWLRGPARRLTATIDGRRFVLRPPATRRGSWEGALRPAGLLCPGAALHVIPDDGPLRWKGRRSVRAVVHLSAIEPGGAKAFADVAIDLHAGYG
jgi:hypothetical protein